MNMNIHEYMKNLKPSTTLGISSARQALILARVMGLAHVDLESVVLPLWYRQSLTQDDCDTRTYLSHLQTHFQSIDDPRPRLMATIDSSTGQVSVEFITLSPTHPFASLGDGAYYAIALYTQDYPTVPLSAHVPVQAAGTKKARARAMFSELLTFAKEIGARDHGIGAALPVFSKDSPPFSLRKSPSIVDPEIPF